MSVEETETPQYVVTAPGDEKTDDDDDKSSTVSTATTKSMSSAINVSTSNRTQNLRSQSFQSASSSTTFDQQSSSSNITASALITQQLKAHSSMNIVTEKHVQRYSSSQTMSASSISSSMSGGGAIGAAGAAATKGRFMSFLQQPDTTSPTMHGSTYLTAQQKHVRQFVRSTSAHSSTESPVGSTHTPPSKPDKCVRSSSQQIEDEHSSFSETTKGLQQSAAILISKSAETFEGIRSCASSNSMRTQLTLSGGFLAPPNRKLTILSPIHAPPGLHDLLRKHRSPLSPRISFPGADAELFP